MATDDAEFADRLNHFLDALAAGSDRSPNGMVPPDYELAATVRQLQANDDAPPADPRFGDRLLEDLMHPTTVHDSVVFPLTPARPTIRDPLAASRSVPEISPPRPGWALVQLATAALVVLALVGSVVALGSLRGRTSAWLPMLPAFSGTPTAEGEIVTETLIDVADATLPAGPVQLYVLVTELQPGVSASLGGQVGTMSYRVEQGTVKVSHSGVEQVVHAGEQWSAPVDGVAALENVGDDVARIVEADVNDALATSSLEASYASKFSDPQGASESFVIQAATDLTTGSGRVTLERLTLPPGTVLDPYTKTQFDWIGIAAGRLGVTLEGERLPFRWDPGEERTFGLVQSMPVIPPGTEVTLRNADDTPLVLYHLTLTPSGTGGSLAATPAP